MVYANSEEVTTLTNEILEPMEDTKASATLTKAISHAERKINSKLRQNNIDIPTIPDDLESIEDDDPILNLLEAGTLYAAAFVFDTGYSGNETSSPTARTYRSDADDMVDAYIEIIREGYNTEDPDTQKSAKIPVGSLVRRCH